MKKIPDISIIIPVYQEETIICETLDTLKTLDDCASAEIIVVDGDPAQRTLRALSSYPVKTLAAPKGRSRQMNAGAAIARGAVLLFLHADSRLPRDALRHIQRVMFTQNTDAGAFELSIDASGPAFRVIERMASWRSRLTRIPYGDQAIFIKRSVFKNLGGYQPIPIMEDINLMQRIKKSGGKIAILRQKVRTSARRWHKEGVLTCTLRNWLISSAYYLGISPEKLKRYYS